MRDGFPRRTAAYVTEGRRLDIGMHPQAVDACHSRIAAIVAPIDPPDEIASVHALGILRMHED